jgi:uncharacterized phiE125 gp8 family phage protein
VPIVTLVAPDGFPVTIEEARSHLRIDGDDDDAAIGRAIAAATARCELFCMCRFVAQTVRWISNGWTTRGLELPLAPVRAVDEVRIETAAGPVILARADYHIRVRGKQTIVQPAPGVSWPAPAPVEEPIAVTFTVGAPPAEIAGHIKTAVLVTAARLYDNRSGDSDMPPAATSLLMGETW